MKLEELEQLAGAATPGERFLDENDGAFWADDGTPTGVREIGDVNWRSADISFGLAASPAAILQLIARLRAAEAVVEAVRPWRAWLQKQPGAGTHEVPLRDAIDDYDDTLDAAEGKETP